MSIILPYPFEVDQFYRNPHQSLPMSLPHTCFSHLSPTTIPQFTTGSQILNKGAITNKNQDDREEEILKMAERKEGGEEPGK